MTEIALMKARDRLSGLNRELRKNPRSVVRISYRGKPAMALMSAELYDTLLETLDALADPETLDALRRSLGNIEAGRLHTLEQVAARLGLSR